VSRPRIAVTAAITAAVAASALAVAPAAQATPRASTSALDKCGFTVKPNLAAWTGGSASLVPTGKAAAGRNVIIQGKAASGLKNGTQLELVRFAPAGKGCHGSFQRIGSGIFTHVRGGQYYLNFQLDRQGTFGYAVQAISGGTTYEIEFRLTTK
jgi:hypothetical protein